MTSNTPCLDEFDRVVRGLRANARNAAKRNKPTMWAYYERMAERLEAHFSTCVAETRTRLIIKPKQESRVADGGIAGVALAIVQSADERCPHVPRDEAADLWALSVYANRILRAWTKGSEPTYPRADRRSLRWLRERAGVVG